MNRSPSSRPVLRWSLCLGVLAAGLPLLGSGRPDDPRTAPLPLPRAHAHNDYLHPRPLLEALDQGFCSVEADILLVEGQLLVAHERPATRPDRTLRHLYLEPLRDRVRQNGGRVYRGGPPVWLLIDLKTAAEPTWTALRAELEAFREMLTEFSDTSIRTNAVTVVLSGNRPTATLATEPRRLAAIDGRLGDLEGTAPVALMPLISDNWAAHFTWRGTRPIDPAERARLRALVERIHRAGRLVRFWSVPDRPEGWSEMFEAGVDLINTDNLAGLREFLLRKP